MKKVQKGLEKESGQTYKKGMTTMTNNAATYRVLNAQDFALLGEIPQDASEKEFAGILKSVGGAEIAWDEGFYKGAVLNENGQVLAVLKS